MSMNPCLQPASLSDVPYARYWEHRYVDQDGQPTRHIHNSAMAKAVLVENESLRALYDAEWQRRGFDRSP